MVTTVHKASWTKTQTRILHQPRATARLTLDLNAPKTSFKGAPADQGRATAQQTSAFEGISHTVLFITGAVVVVCLATIAICILKPTKQVELVWRNEPMPAAPPPPFVTITAPVAPAAVVLPAQRQPSAVGHPVAESHRSSMVPKSIRRMQARGMARDKFNQRAMTLTTSETDTWQSSVTEP
ncbi:SCP domain-containing protein [Plasmodiophora brassicae]